MKTSATELNRKKSSADIALALRTITLVFHQKTSRGNVYKVFLQIKRLKSK